MPEVAVSKEDAAADAADAEYEATDETPKQKRRRLAEEAKQVGRGERRRVKTEGQGLEG